MNVFEGIKTISAGAAFTIGPSGEILTESDSVVQKESTLKIGAVGGSVTMSGGSMFFGNGSVVSGGGTSLNIDGVSVQSLGNKFILKGPPNRILVVNGVQTTFGSVNAGANPMPHNEEPRKTYKLAQGTLINNLIISGHGDCTIDAQFLNENLGITVNGSGKFKLPGRTFANLNLTISGSGDICGADGDRATKTFYLQSKISGSGDISDLIVLESGSVSIAGSGDINIEAVDPSQVVRSVAGSGRVRVRRTTNTSVLDDSDTDGVDQASKRTRKEK